MATAGRTETVHGGDPQVCALPRWVLLATS